MFLCTVVDKKSNFDMWRDRGNIFFFFKVEEQHSEYPPLPPSMRQKVRKQLFPLNDIFLRQQVKTERCRSSFLAVALTKEGQKTACPSSPCGGTPAEGE